MSDLKQTVGFLQNVPLFHGLNNRHLELLAKRMVDRHYAAGQPIVTQGHGGEGFFVIVSGKAEAYRERFSHWSDAMLNLTRWASPRAIKELFVPPVDYRYPHMG